MNGEVSMTRKILLLIILNASLATISAQPLLVSAASSLTTILPQIAKDFQKAHPGSKIKFNFAASGTLQHQIEQGAPADVFIPAAQQQMDVLQRKQLIDASTRKNICGAELLLLASNSSELRDWKDLTNPKVKRIAICNPASVPAGMYAKQTLTALGLWDVLKSKFVYSENVRQTLAYVEGVNVDAGIVYRSDALVAKHSKVIAVAPPNTHDVIFYPAAVVIRSKQQALAKAFVEYLVSPSAQRVMSTQGFMAP